MKKLIILSITLLTLSACSQLGLSTTESAEPVDLSGIEKRLDAIEVKQDAIEDKVDEIKNPDLSDIEARLDTIEAILNPTPTPAPFSLSNLYLYGRILRNPVVTKQPLILDLETEILVHQSLNTNVKKERCENQKLANPGTPVDQIPECDGTPIELFASDGASIIWKGSGETIAGLFPEYIAKENYVEFVELIATGESFVPKTATLKEAILPAKLVMNPNDMPIDPKTNYPSCYIEITIKLAGGEEINYRVTSCGID